MRQSQEMSHSDVLRQVLTRTDFMALPCARPSESKHHVMSGPGIMSGGRQEKGNMTLFAGCGDRVKAMVNVRLGPRATSHTCAAYSLG